MWLVRKLVTLVHTFVVSPKISTHGILTSIPRENCPYQKTTALVTC